MTITDKIITMKGGKAVELNSSTPTANATSEKSFADNILDRITNTAKKISQQLQNVSGIASDRTKNISKQLTTLSGNATASVNNTANDAANKMFDVATNTASVATNNIRTPFKDLNVLYPIIIVIVLLIIVLFAVLFKVKIPFTKPSKSKEETVANIFIVLFFILLVIGICVTLLPGFKDVKNLFEQISNVTYVIIYTIFLILFFTMTPDDTINKYAYIIIPFTVLFGIFMFYKGFSSNYTSKFNVNYERIKSMILLFCLITTFIVYYNIDPGGYIKESFGYSFLITIIVSVFAFLYLMIVLTMSDNSQNSTGSTSNNFLNNFSGISSYGSLGFLLFIITVTITISTYPGGFFKDKSMASFGMIMILLISILSSLVLGFNLFPEADNNSVVSDKMNLFKRSLLFLFGIIISSLIIFWIVYNVQNVSGKSGTTSFVLNLILVAFVLGLIYKTIIVRLPIGNEKKNAFFALILSTLFYIPCLFNGVFDSIGKIIVGEYQSTTMGSVLMLVAIICLITIYYMTPSVFNKINLQGGKQLVNNPVYTDTLYPLGTYEELNGSDKFDYQYAISCWVFLDAVAPNMNESYNKYTSLLNFGDKPNILYKGETNTLMVTIQQKNLNTVNNSNLVDFDEEGNRIIYKNSKVLLQKWNNIIINYNSGVLDIFLNGELVKSNIGVVPYYTLDNLTIGHENGIKGGICNVVYFKRALTSPNIYYLYNMVKDKNPPILNDSNKTIMDENVKTSIASDKKIV
jgi:hypothetical protein